jgi:hypothetical protein
MHPGEVVLSVDYGAVTTGAVLVGPGGVWESVRWDGTDRLASAVLLNPDGSWVTGALAWQLGAGAPERFESAPVRLLREQRVRLGGVEIDPVDLVAVTLRRVAQAATARLRGAPLSEVRLVVPAGWGPRRRTALREAARRAGLGQPSLVAAASAAASHVVASGVQVVVGSFLLVCDWGGGFTASVLRRTRYGFEVLSTIEAWDAGGLALDQVLAEQLSALAVAGVGGPARLSAGESIGVWSAARETRELLSSAASATVALPSGPPVVVTAAGVEASFAPVVERAANAVRMAIDAAELPVGELAGVFCVGGVACSPVMVDLLARRCGLVFTAVSEPQRAAVLGAAHATGPGVDTVPDAGVVVPPVPGWRQPAAALVPGFASLGLMTQFLATAKLNRVAAGIGYDPDAYLLADWGELALAGLFALLTCLTSATVIAAAIPVDNPLGSGRSSGGRGQQIGTALLAACGMGLAVACLYAVFDAAVVGYSNAPFLRWALLPLVPLVAVILVTAALATRYGRVPSGGWHVWLGFPPVSVLATAVGMALMQHGLAAPRYDWQEHVLDVLLRVGGVAFAVGSAMAVARRWHYRLILAAPLAVFTAGVVAPSTTGVLACLYVAVVTGWWGRRAWELAFHPDGSLPRPS